MKLSELAIDGSGLSRRIQLGRFSEGLNFVYGEHDAAKTMVRQFVRSMLVGSVRSAANHQTANSYSIPNRLEGFLSIRNGLHETQVSRDLDGAVRCQTVLGEPMPFETLTSRLTPDVYDSIFSFSLNQTRDNVARLANILTMRLGVARGASAAGDEFAYQNWKRETDLRNAQLHSIQRRIEELNREKTNRLQQMETLDASRRSRLADLESQLQSLAVQLQSPEFQAQKQQLVTIEREISQLRGYIDSAVKQVAYIPQPATPNDSFAALYQRLDEIDNQIRRWRRVQSDIQAQRVKLKDEMVVWNDLTLESSEHPYHNAREILLSLESKVDQAERTAASSGQAGAYRNDPARLTRTIQDLCKQMRDDLYGLCQELAQQYKHIRHKAAAAELKQLRRCYNEMGENTERLVRRRDAVISEIRNIDPAGAEAIVRSEVGFCQCALHEGYLEARKKFVGNAPSRTPLPVSHQVIQPDLTAPRQQLNVLESQRREIQAWLDRHEFQLAEMKTKQATLLHQREAISAELDANSYHSSIQQIESDLDSLRTEYQILLRRVEEDRRYVHPVPNPVLVRAARLLEKATSGNLAQVFLSENDEHSEFQIRNDVGKVLNFTALDADDQDAVYLSLAIAGSEAFALQGIKAPLIIDDAFTNLSGAHVNAMLDLCQELAAGGQQLILLTRHRYLADRLPGVPVFELPPLTGFPETYVKPERNLNPWTIPSRNSAAFEMPQDVNYAQNYPSTAAIEINQFAEPASYIVPYSVPFPPADIEVGPRRTSSVSTISVDSFGDRLGYASGIDDNTDLERIELLDLASRRGLADSRITSVGQLLELDPDQLPVGLLDRGLTGEQVDRWQAQVWLLCNVPGLRVNDAQLLVACGVTEPEHLATSDARQLHERISRFLGSSAGFRFANSGGSAGSIYSINLERIDGWYRALDRTRSRWQTGNGFFSRSSRRRNHFVGNPLPSRTPRSYQFEPDPRMEVRNSQPERSPGGFVHRDNSRPTRDLRDAGERGRTSTNQPPREPFVARPAPRMKTFGQNVNPAPALAPVPPKTTIVDSESHQHDHGSNDGKFRFYLDLKDHVEAAPSIGPKTAERFERIGVFTVGDFLKQTAESMAAKIKYKRISADVVRQWQQQTRLVCQIPNLRGHDAQLLVACGFTEAESIAASQPNQLLAKIGPFADSKEGLKIIRNGKKPDLQEVTNWIAWAENTRSLQAA